jgi:hypothetical protein
MSILLNDIHSRIQEIENRIKKIDELLINIENKNEDKIKNLQKLQELSKNIKDNLIKQKSPSPKQKSPSPDYRYQVGYYNLKEYVDELKSVLSKEIDIEINKVCETIKKINELRTNIMFKNIIIDKLNTDELEKYLILEKLCGLSKYSLSYEELKFMYILKQKLKKEDLLSLDINQLRRIMERYNGIWTPHKPKIFNSKELNILNKADEKINLQNKIEEKNMKDIFKYFLIYI